MHQDQSFTGSLINSFDQPSALLNEKFEISHANDSFCELLKTEPGKISGESFLNLFNNSSGKPGLKKKLDNILKSAGEILDEEVVCVAKSAENFKASLSAKLVEGDGGSGKGILVFLKPIYDEVSSDSAGEIGDSGLESFFDAIDDPIFVLSTDRTILDANTAALKLLNLSRDEVEGKKCFELIHEGKIPENCPLSETLESKIGAKAVMELEILSSTFEVITYPVYKDGRIDRAIHYMKDISVEKRLMDELEKKEELYRLLYEHAGEPIFTYNKNLELIDLNSIACKLAGHEKEELLGRNIFELGILHPEDEKLVSAHLERLLSMESTIETEKLRLKRHDGTYRTFEVIAAAVYTKGELLGITNICHDVTELERLLEQVKESEEKYRAIAESSHAGVLVVDDNYKILYANSVLCEMLRKRRDGVVGHDFREFLDEESVKLVVDRYVRRQRGEDVPSRYEFSIVRADGKKRLVELHSTVVKDSKGMVKTISQILDITDQRKIEEEKEKLNAQLIHAQKMEAIGRLAGGMAHDFNNMLNVIIGYAELVKERIGPEDSTYEDIIEILRAGEHASALTEKLLAFARSEVIEPRVVNLNKAIEESIQMLQRLVGEDVDVKFFPEKKIWNVKLDPTQVEHVLANLATNARDAIPGTGTITVETANVVLSEDYCKAYPDLKPGEYVVMEFTDSGVGMDAETQKKIFEPFFTTKEYGKGTGLGLSSVYGIVKQNSGLINVYSEPGKGTTFKVYFPRYEGEEVHDLREPKVVSRNLNGTETVFVIDDREQILSICKRTLERLGYSVLTAKSPSEAIKITRSFDGEIHLVLADVILPEMNGRELAQKIASFKPGVKVIYMSGYTANAIAHRGILDAGINFLQKPFSPTELAVKVREVLDSAE